MLAMGIDIGTTSLSMVLLDAGTGELVDRLTANTEAFVPDGHPGGRTQDPEKIVRLVREGMEAMIERTGRPGCIGLTGQMHGMLYADGEGRAVSPLYTWQDPRGGEPLADGRSATERLRAAGCASAAGYGLATHLALFARGETPAGAARMVTIPDYLAMKLTGDPEPRIGADMAASWGCFDLKERRFQTAALEAAGVDPAILPRLTQGHAIAGRTPEGVPVAVAIGDNQASVLGSVRDVAHTALINIGTGSQISLGVAGYIDVQGGIELRPCTAESSILVGSGLCGGRAYAMLERFYRELTGAQDGCYGLMARQAEAFVERFGWDAAWRVRTTFSGTRDDPAARGGMDGIGEDNFRPGALTAGMIAGILGELHDYYDRMCALSGGRAAALVGSGNGLRRNPLMRSLAQTLFGLPLRVPAWQEEAGCGAALVALAAAGCVPDLTRAQELIRYEE